MFLVSRKFHDSFGAPGTEVTGTPEEKKAKQAVGWEWWPSIFWQMTWAWIIAPIVLWKSRRIHDTHGWRLQTIACCLASYVTPPQKESGALANFSKATLEPDVADCPLRPRHGAGQRVLHPAPMVRYTPPAIYQIFMY